MPRPTMGAPHPVMVRHGPPGTSLHARPSMGHPGPLTEAVGVGLRQGTAWRVMGLSMREITNMSGTMSPLPMSRASPMATHTHMGEIRTHTLAHLGLPDMGPLHPLIRIREGYPMATAHPHPHHTVGDHQGHHPTHTTAPLTPEDPERACTNLIVRRMRMTGASNNRQQ